MRISVFQGPHSQILMIGGEGGGSDRGSYFIPKESQLQNLSTQKKSLLFLAYPKKSLFFFMTQNNPIVFHRPQKRTFGQNLRPQKSLEPPPPVIKICEWGPWGVCPIIINNRNLYRINGHNRHVSLKCSNLKLELMVIEIEISNYYNLIQILNILTIQKRNLTLLWLYTLYHTLQL